MTARRFALSLLLLLVMAHRMVWAHPMGNFSVNHLSKIKLQSERISIQYFIDLAEIPTFQELQQGNLQANAGDPAVARFVAARGADLGQGLHLIVGGDLLNLKLVSSDVIFPPGAGGLPTMKMGFVYEASYPNGLDRSHLTLQFADQNYPGHSGWKEITAETSVGTMLESSAPQTDRSAGLTNYPTDLLSSPPQDLEASLVAALPAITSAPAGAAIDAIPLTARASSTRPVDGSVHSSLRIKTESGSKPCDSIAASKPVEMKPSTTADANVFVLKPNRQLTPRNRFTELITAQDLSPWFLFTAAFIAIGLGALHALEPGHGKTIVAAYLVGSRGTARHATLLGIIVTASHTAGVFALGAVTLYASRYIVPEKLYPWLGVFAGMTIAGLGAYLFLRRWTGAATDHSHANGESHFNWLVSRLKRAPKDLNGSTSAAKGSVSITQLFTLGITGGIIPCPAALIVLLSAFSLHRVGLGFFLIVAFSAGLAAVLIGFGLLMVYARRFMARVQMDGPLTTRWLPLASSAFILVLGLVLTVQAYSATHLSLFVLSKERIGPLLFVTGLGLILGVRHSTDADHVVAISTIVSKQRSIRNAALIGSVWGLGHTITIFAVGSLIILSGVEIPPRLGLSMEFSVALMLILLGILNLTGTMKKMTAFLTPSFQGASDLAADSADSPVAGPGASKLRSTVKRLGVYQCLRPLVIGLVHGLAGSAAVALLVLSTIHSPIWATVYLLIFGAGTMVGMMIMTAAIAVPLAWGGDRFAKLGNYFGVASGMVSLCFGAFLVYQLGFLGGLFTSHPQWIPR